MVKKSINFLFENSVFLLVGAVAALIWANCDLEEYHHFWHAVLLDSGMTLHFLVNDFLMMFFFAIAAKEVRESFLPGGDLSDLKKAATPLIATVGGVVVPAVVYLCLAGSFGQMETMGKGWAIPCATDIAFCYLVARLIFGPGHPAITFLLLLAIVDDAIGLVILAVFYPQKELQPEWFLLTAAAIGITITMQRVRLGERRILSFWWYLLIPGVLSWISFHEAGIHAALGLVPIIPFIPHAKSDLGIFAKAELGRHDTLNEFEHWWKNPVEIILGLFGLANAGVMLSSVTGGTGFVLAGLFIGKPLGIVGFTLVAGFFGFHLPKGMEKKDLFVASIAAAIGFTVALFVADTAFSKPGLDKDGARMGALLSLSAAPIAIVVAKVLRVRKFQEK